MELFEDLKYAWNGLIHTGSTHAGDLYRRFDRAVEEHRARRWVEPLQGYAPNMRFWVPWRENRDINVFELQLNAVKLRVDAHLQRGYREEYEPTLEAFAALGADVHRHENENAQLHALNKRFGEDEYIVLTPQQRDYLHALEHEELGDTFALTVAPNKLTIDHRIGYVGEDERSYRSVKQLAAHNARELGHVSTWRDEYELRIKTSDGGAIAYRFWPLRVEA